MKLCDRDYEVTVFWDDLLDALRGSDPVTADAIGRHAFRWVDRVVHVQGR